MDWNHLLPYLAPVLIVALLARRLIRNAPRKVRPGRLFILPAIIAFGVIAALAASPMPPPFWIAGYIVAVALGAGAGFLTTHHQEFSIDAATGEVSARATPIGSMLIVALFALRFGLRFVMPGIDPYGPPHGHPSADVIGWSNASLMFATGLVFARAITTWFHARPLIAAHKAQKALSPDAAPRNQ